MEPPSPEPVFDPELFALRPWYHDFRSLGYDTLFLDEPFPWAERVSRARRFLSSRMPLRLSSGLQQERLQLGDIFHRHRRASSHALNQQAKQAVLLPMVEAALSKLGANPKCLDLFCADGYYACQMKTMAPRATVIGVDLDERAVERARTISRKLGLAIDFDTTDATAALAGGPYDLLFCAGGLYHLEDPESFLRHSRAACRGLAVFQSVVSHAEQDAGYFETPAPGLSHGSRFSHAWLARCLRGTGFEPIVEHHYELPANPRLEDRGSSYFACRPADEGGNVPSSKAETTAS